MLELLCEATGGFMFTAGQVRGRENLHALSRAYQRYADTVGAFANWESAIDALLRLGERNGKPALVVLDEFPYLLESEPGLPSVVQNALSTRGRAIRQSRTRLILCGSTVGMAPLRGRAVMELNLPTLDYREAARFWGLDAHADLAFRVYALVGGTPAYAAMSNGPVRGERDFNAWVLRGLLNPASAMFREGNILLDEQPLEEIQWVDDALHPRRPIYRITEPVIRFHELVIRNNEALIVGGRGREVWETVQETVSAKVYGPAFEDIAREWTVRYAPRDFVGAVPSRVRPAKVACREHGLSHELDVVVLDGDRVVAIGEAKASTRMVGEEQLRRLEHVRELIGAGEARLLLFGRTGFTVALRRLAERRGDVGLVDLAMLYGPG